MGVVVMLVEITGDPLIILPVGIATLTAVAVANCFNHGLYHSLIDIQSFPFLPDKWPRHLTDFHIKEILPPYALATVSRSSTRAELEELLHNFKYKAFPVVN